MPEASTKKKKHSALGAGLDALIPPARANGASAAGKSSGGETKKDDDGRVMMDINKVEPDKNQPRKNFDEDELDNLVDSIKLHGIFQPLLVQKKDDYYMIIAGERRWRAAKKAGLKEVPVIVCNYSEQEIVEIQLIENIQREDLNPIEEAQGYKKLMEDFDLTQDQIAEKVSKKRSTITNAIRLLKLDPRVQEMLVTEKLSGGHARALLAIENGDKQYEFAQKVFDESMSVRDVEKAVKKLAKEDNEKPGQPTGKEISPALAAIYADTEEKLKQHLGTKVKISPKDKTCGKIEIEYYSEEELTHLVDRLQQM